MTGFGWTNIIRGFSSVITISIGFFGFSTLTLFFTNHWPKPQPNQSIDCQTQPTTALKPQPNWPTTHNITWTLIQNAATTSIHNITTWYWEKKEVLCGFEMRCKERSLRVWGDREFDNERDVEMTWGCERENWIKSTQNMFSTPAVPFYYWNTTVENAK